MNNEFVKIDPDPTAEEFADEEEAVAERYEELGVGEEDVAFLRADAAERRRLAAIIKEQEKEEEDEIKAIKADRRKKKAKKAL